MVDQTKNGTDAIRRKRASLERQEEKVEAAFASLRAQCPHHTPFMKYDGSSRNYDPSDDCFWIAWHCPDCGKRWITDQTREGGYGISKRSEGEMINRNKSQFDLDLAIQHAAAEAARLLQCRWPWWLRSRFCLEHRRSVPGNLTQCFKCGECFDER